ncbi:UDP-2,3-diacylglucosamine diphosphatase [Pseudomonas knackmussii]|uniref:UDP-2,3-diacylglucosamine hydrolase n=1 Tax=Pseudomonas knackmussii TaxID=65741 RepID=A0ABY4KMV2_9PSED|nr:UDP-2,3-diacylglucosamine diphosphatase [Pseudomonas knackmussii]UPQ81008.1 UDP-2,3-diacylglucosamine diphosphatase [Pseudomonas knackmussii]
MILLISDLHLEEKRPDITRAFLRFLESRATHADALYILGDFFEVWVGDDGMTPYQHEIAEALNTLSQHGTRIYLMHGNRDFMIGKAFCRKAGCTLLSDPHIAQFGGERVLLMHGDSLCTRDEGYMRLRRLLRNPISLFILHHLSLSKRQKLAQKLRSSSKTETRMKASDIIDVTPAEVVSIMQRQGVRTLIHGHTHRPAIHTLELAGDQAQRIVLGDWDRKGWVLQVDQTGFNQTSFDLS